ncbi:MBL fold metallo-hydrolase [Actinomadura opuntiae]|uniref:MBL fold metallo-hydrolase n=1 Tax=Actinomadura sp. OS1-43 TaxID=604315 RepID=UPI00255AFE14|nr:MBL fold metallo-hydrolase [Actinomadura sp. OS1-43]MDL4816094.1 MBL fold metallo-hydrolase [Actinomadura sp. OS1-43]
MPADTAALTFVGNATTIIRYGGVTLLTDPNFLRRGERADLGYGLTSKRVKDPAIGVGELPELDGVVLSHLHGDHWDPVAERHLDRGLPILTTGAAARALRNRGFREAEGLRIWQTEEITKGDHRIRITAMPGRHAPGLLRHVLPPVMGSLLEFGPPRGEPHFRLYISGDTLMYDEIAEIRHRYPDIDAGVVHLGGTRLLGLLTVTMDGRQGAQWLETTGCATAVPVHYDDYTVMKSPLSDFDKEVGRRGMGARLRHVERGGTITLGRAEHRTPAPHR